MLAPSTQELATTHNQPGAAPAAVRADHISKSGRALTVVIFGCAIALLLLTFAWMAARRINSVFINRGDAAMQAQDYRAALSDYTWAARFDRGDAHTYLNRGYAFRWLNDDRRAVLDFGRYIELRPDLASGYYARARSEVRLGQAEAAIADFGAAIAREPSN